MVFIMRNISIDICLISWIKSIWHSKLHFIESLVWILCYKCSNGIIHSTYVFHLEDFVTIATYQILSWIKSIKNSKLDIIESIVIFCCKCSNGNGFYVFGIWIELFWRKKTRFLLRYRPKLSANYSFDFDIRPKPK